MQHASLPILRRKVFRVQYEVVVLKQTVVADSTFEERNLRDDVITTGSGFCFWTDRHAGCQHCETTE